MKNGLMIQENGLTVRTWGLSHSEKSRTVPCSGSRQDRPIKFCQIKSPWTWHAKMPIL